MPYILMKCSAFSKLKLCPNSWVPPTQSTYIWERSHTAIKEPVPYILMKCSAFSKLKLCPNSWVLPTQSTYMQNNTKLPCHQVTTTSDCFDEMSGWSQLTKLREKLTLWIVKYYLSHYYSIALNIWCHCDLSYHIFCEK